jgi:DNA-binding response OmpR family regulator
MKGDQERCLGAGMDGYVAKPFHAEELFAAIERALDDHKLHDDDQSSRGLTHLDAAPPVRHEATPSPWSTQSLSLRPA